MVNIWISKDYPPDTQVGIFEVDIFHNIINTLYNDLLYNKYNMNYKTNKEVLIRLRHKDFLHFETIGTRLISIPNAIKDNIFNNKCYSITLESKYILVP